jgi:hypothetical protein
MGARGEVHAKVINEAVINWCKAWVLIGGVVTCSKCLHGQPLSERGESFPHGPSCDRHDDAEVNPWVALHDILNAGDE